MPARCLIIRIKGSSGALSTRVFGSNLVVASVADLSFWYARQIPNVPPSVKGSCFLHANALENVNQCIQFENHFLAPRVLEPDVEITVDAVTFNRYYQPASWVRCRGLHRVSFVIRAISEVEPYKHFVAGTDS